ncbi:MAG: hypothetical protein NW215_07840 [Hyphomicrobiales bacterium]|nr:hypothetical protein [Hyphomicrobiales bacterium]
MIQSLFKFYWSYSFFIFIFLIILFIMSRRAEASVQTIFHAPFNQKIIGLFPYIVIGLATLHCVLYLLVPNFVDYGEPVIPLMAGNLLSGAPVYSDWEEGQSITGSNYGPVVFLTQLPALLIQSFAASKLVGVVSGLGVIWAVYLIVRRETDGHFALIICTALVGLLAFNLHYWFWNRTDSFIVLIVALCCLAHQRLTAERFLPVVAGAAAIAMNLKLFAPLYLIPLAVVCVLAVPISRKSATILLASTLMFLVLLVLPFIVFDFSGAAYLRNILIMRKQGFDLPAAANSLLYGVVLAAPALYFWRRDLSVQAHALTLSLVVCILIAAVLSGKPGGGQVYMMPFAPLSLYVAVVLFVERQRSDTGKQKVFIQYYAVVAVACAAPIWAYSFYQVAQQIPRYGPEADTSSELRALFERHPRAEMGHGLTFKSSRPTEEYYRVHKAFLGQPVRFDYVNYSDQRLAGVPASVVHPLLEGCSVPDWIFAKTAAKFDKAGYFGVTLFDDKTRTLFNENYRLSYETTYFEVWSCKTP